MPAVSLELAVQSAAANNAAGVPATAVLPITSTTITDGKRSPSVLKENMPVATPHVHTATAQSPLPPPQGNNTCHEVVKAATMQALGEQLQQVRQEVQHVHDNT